MTTRKRHRSYYRKDPVPIVTNPTPLQLKMAYRSGRISGECSDGTVKNPYHPADLRHECWEYGHETGRKRWTLLPVAQEDEQ